MQPFFLQELDKIKISILDLQSWNRENDKVNGDGLKNSSDSRKKINVGG